VETNNTGGNDTLEFHEKGAYSEAKRYSLGASLCPGLKLPFLVPAFPRPQTAWKYYTHALDRDVALLKDNEMARLDLQLIAMIKDAQEQLRMLQIDSHEKILMTGFSASGTFANRFTLIHPEMVAGVACGGINAMPILPVKKIGSTKLIYPVGIYDYAPIFNDSVHLSSYKKVPQYIYMGAKDSNDAVLFDDAYSDKERKIIYRKLGKIMQPDRWEKVQSIYTDEKVNATFKTYPRIGHETDKEVYEDVISFFKKIIQQYN
jgi:predicted esterase